ncbi:neutral zinc metallopeptidase [Kribbella sp. GL6]|uniref:neutral zinc metallopeptidase n=1 Tax=Kribbella sp. GL6 TaxID=3419765 RepID=UPI003CFF76FD
MYYSSRPLPVASRGGSARQGLSWGSSFAGVEDALEVWCAHRRRRRDNLVAGVLLGSAAILLVIGVALGVRQHQSETALTAPTTPTADGWYAAPKAVPKAAAAAFYGTGRIGAVDCRAAQAPLDTRAAVRAFDTRLVGCLHELWSPKVRAAQVRFSPPRVVFWGGYLQSPCASGPSVAFYCGSTQTLYLNYASLVAWSRFSDFADRFARMWAIDTTARAYGYHVLQLTGILASAHRFAYVAPNLRLEQGRRIELQASCLSGLFIAASRSSSGLTDLDLMIDRQYVVPQNGAATPTDRASVANGQYWAARGLDTNDVASCNTFKAPASSTS